MNKKKRQQLKAYTKNILLYVVDKEPIEVLESTPSSIRRAIGRLTLKQLKKSPGTNKWSIAEIVAHLADSEVVLGYRLRKVISEPGSRIESYNQNLWAKNLSYRTADCREKLATFSALRKSNTRMLRSLKVAAWKRYGIHQERGRETIERMVLLHAGHDMNHLKQVQHIAENIKR